MSNPRGQATNRPEAVRRSRRRRHLQTASLGPPGSVERLIHSFLVQADLRWLVGDVRSRRLLGVGPQAATGSDPPVKAEQQQQQLLPPPLYLTRMQLVLLVTSELLDNPLIPAHR